MGNLPALTGSSPSFYGQATFSPQEFEKDFHSATMKKVLATSRHVNDGKPQETVTQRCPRCGIPIQRNEFGVGQCRTCHRVNDPLARKREGTHRLQRLVTTQTRVEEMADFYGWSGRRMYDRMRRGEVLGTITLDGQTQLQGSLCTPRVFILPRGLQVKTVTVSGSVGVSRLNLTAKRPCIALCPEGQSYKAFRLKLITEGGC